MKLPALRTRRRATSGGDEIRGPTPPWRRLLRVPTLADLRTMLARNPGLKLVSLVLAIFLWASINVTERDAERKLEVVVSLRKTPAGVVVTESAPKSVAVTLRGPRTLLEGLEDQRFRVQVPPDRLEVGESRIELGPEMLTPEVPRRLKVLRYEPPRLRVRAERLVRRRLPVKPDLAGAPALGYTLAESTATPNVVEVSGPASMVESLKEVPTAPINLQGVSSTIVSDVLLDDTETLLRFDPDIVSVTVKIEEAVVSREFHKVPILVRGAAATEVTPPAIDLTIRGPQRLLHNLKLEADAVTAQATGLGAGRHTVEVRVALPEGLVVAEQSADKVRVKIPAGGGSR